MAQDQAGFNWQQYAADNPDVLATGYGIGTYNNAADQMWGHYNEANRLGDHRAYTGYESIMEPTLAENFSRAPVGFSTGDGGNGFQAPTFDAADIGNWKVASGTGDSWDGSFREGYGLNMDYGMAQQKYGEIGKHLALPSQNGASSNYMIMPGGNEKDGFQMMVKSGEKAGTVLNYKLQNGQWVPQQEGMVKQRWDTNAGKQNLDLLKVALTAVGGAFMGPALEGAGAAISAGSMPTVSQMGTIASMANTASGGQIPGLNLVGAAAGGYGALGNLASGSGGYMDAIKAAMAAQKLYGGYQNLTQDPSNPSGGGGRVPGMVGGANSQMPGQAGGGSGMGWLDQLFNMGGAMYSANKNDNYADELRQERARSLAERQPFLDRVGQLSGDAGAEQFRGGGTWQAAERVAANNFTRKDAQRGNLANDTDRTRLLQDHFMKSLESERGAARADLNSFDEKASRDAFMKGLEMDRMKNSPLFAGAAYGQGGGAGTLAGMSPQVIDMLKQIPGGLQYLQSLMGGGGASSPMPSVPSGVAFDGDYSGGTTPYDGAGPGFDYSDDYSSWFGDDYFGGSGTEF